VECTSTFMLCRHLAAIRTSEIKTEDPEARTEARGEWMAIFRKLLRTVMMLSRYCENFSTPKRLHTILRSITVAVEGKARDCAQVCLRLCTRLSSLDDPRLGFECLVRGVACPSVKSRLYLGSCCHLILHLCCMHGI